MQDKFNYPSSISNNSNDDIDTFEYCRVTNMKNKQQLFINSILNKNGMIIDNDIEVEDNNDNYEVEKIINHRRYKKRIKYLIKWKDYDDSYNSWIWEDAFNDRAIIEEYHAELEEL